MLGNCEVKLYEVIDLQWGSTMGSEDQINTKFSHKR